MHRLYPRCIDRSLRYRSVAMFVVTLIGGALTAGALADDASDLASAKSLSRAFRNVAETTTPSVVTLSVSKNLRNVLGGDGENPFTDRRRSELFRRFQEEMRRNPERFQQNGVGSGVIIDTSGIILTNHHVVQGADRVVVRLHDGREFEATDIRTDEATDLAVLRIEGAENLTAARLGDSDQMDIGDWVIAIGTPFELEFTVSAGIISGKGRSLRDSGERDRRTTFLQTDAAINPGNSGGPLLNLDGEVIGINTAIASRSGGNDGIGFAVPSNLVRWISRELIAHGEVRRAYLGVSIAEITASIARQFGLERGSGVLVAEVRSGSPAESAGLQVGDVITRIGGTAVRTPGELQRIVERSSTRSTQTLAIVRDDQSQTLRVRLSDLPPPTEL
ncbi:MAG: PDZ domain-containing protein [Planctomycetota bacterium]|nr:MAG: PDZ domain-containing protein [Planctomycetota bacterium]